MLVLKRKPGEKIEIGGLGVGGSGIIVEVCEVGPNWARIGVTADTKIPVHRQEVAARIRSAETKRESESA